MAVSLVLAFHSQDKDIFLETEKHLAASDLECAEEETFFLFFILKHMV